MSRFAIWVFLTLLSLSGFIAQAQFATSSYGLGEIKTGTPGSSLFNENSYDLIGGIDLSALSSTLDATCSATNFADAVSFMDTNADGILTCQEVVDVLAATSGISFTVASPQQAPFIIRHLDACLQVDATCLDGAVSAANDFLISTLDCGSPDRAGPLTGLGTGVDGGVPISTTSYPSLDIFDTDYDGDIYDTEVVNLFGAWQAAQPSSANVPNVEIPSSNPGLYADAYLTACAELANDETLVDVIATGNASDPLGTILFAEKRQKAVDGNLTMADLDELSLTTTPLGTPDNDQMDYLMAILDTSSTATKDDWQTTINGYTADAHDRFARDNCYADWQDRERAVALDYDGSACADGDLWAMAKGLTENPNPTSRGNHPLQTAGNRQIATAQYEADCDAYIARTDGVTGDGCTGLNKTDFTTVKLATDGAVDNGYASDVQYRLADALGYEQSCEDADLYHEAQQAGILVSMCDGAALRVPTAQQCTEYITSIDLRDTADAVVTGCPRMTRTQFAAMGPWLDGAPDRAARANCYENAAERDAAISLGYNGESCDDGKLYARALGRILINHPSEVLLQIAFASGSTSNNVQIGSNQYEADCDNYISETDGVTGAGCADLTRDQFAAIKTNHDAAQNNGFGSWQDRTAALAASPPHALNCTGANNYYVSVGSLTNPTLNPACALEAPFTGIAGPGCWDDILAVTWSQHGDYQKDDFACVLRNTDTTGPRFGDTTLANLTDGEFLYLKECFHDEGNNRTVQALRDCATSASAWDQAVFPIREFSTARWGGSGTGSCSLTLDQIEALGAFDDLNEGTFLTETKNLFNGNHCRKIDGSGEEVNCKEIVCDALRNPPVSIRSTIFANRSHMQNHMCGSVNQAFKQKAYHYKVKKHFFVEACQAPVVGTSDDFDIVSWPMVKSYKVYYGFLRGRAPHQNATLSGVSYYPDAGPETWETERSLVMGRFEHNPVPTSWQTQPGEVPVSAGRKDLKIYAFGNVGRHRQTTFSFDVRFKNNLCISNGIYQPHNSYPDTGRWNYALDYYWKPFPVSIMPNDADAARNARQRGALEGTADSTMTIALIGSSAGSASVGSLQAASTGQTSFERNHFSNEEIGAVKITGLPNLGSLIYRASAVTAGQILPTGDLSELKYEPPSGAPASASNYTSFGFRTYAPWSSVETAIGVSSFACHEVPDFGLTADIPAWAWPDKVTTDNHGAHRSSGHGYYDAKCSGQGVAASKPGGADWTTPSDYQKVFRFINIPTPSDPSNYTPASPNTTGIPCDN